MEYDVKQLANGDYSVSVIVKHEELKEVLYGMVCMFKSIELNLDNDPFRGDIIEIV